MPWRKRNSGAPGASTEPAAAIAEAPFEEAAPVEANKPLSEKGKRFWETDAFIEHAPTFEEQLAEAIAHPEERGNTIMAQSAAIFGQYTNTPDRRSKVTFTEAEGIIDLHSFLSKVKQTAERDTSEVGSQMLKEAEEFESSLSFLGSKEYETACDSLADMWAEYVAQGPGHVINLHTRRQYGDVRKSYHEVTDHVFHAFLKKVEGTPLADRIRRNPETWVDGPDAKLVTVDDWSISGHTLDKAIQYAASAADSAGLPGLGQKVEGHLLIARPQQVGERQLDETTAYTIRSQYLVGGEESRKVPPTSGAHASVDYGFEMPLERMQAYIESRGEKIEAPLLVDIQRPYGAGSTQSEHAMRILERAATLNAQLTQAQNQEHHFRGLTRTFGGATDENLAKISEAMQAARAAGLELSELKQAYATVS
jgi:hypothetical protein